MAKKNPNQSLDVFDGARKKCNKRMMVMVVAAVVVVMMMRRMTIHLGSGLFFFLGLHMIRIRLLMQEYAES